MRSCALLLAATAVVGCKSTFDTDPTEDAVADVWQCLEGDPFPGKGNSNLSAFAIDPPWQVTGELEGIEVVDVTATRRTRTGADFDLFVVLENTSDKWICPSLADLELEASNGAFSPGDTIFPSQMWFSGQSALDAESGAIYDLCIAPGHAGVGTKWFRPPVVFDIVGVQFAIQAPEEHILQDAPGRVRLLGYTVKRDTLNITLSHFRGSPMYVAPVPQIATLDANGRYRNIGFHHGEGIVLAEGDSVVFTDDHPLIALQGQSVCAEVSPRLPEDAPE